MRRALIGLFLAALSLSCLYASVSTPDPAIMKLSEVKKGMEGEGKTIFKGTKIERFKFKVLGVIEKFAPHKNLIIIEILDSPVLSEAGIIAGMSGSPAYINGKLIGAVAYGFAFSKRPIGGITPIEDIIEIDRHNKKSGSIDISNFKISFENENVTFIRDFLRKELARRVNVTPNESITPIKLIGHHKGMQPEALADFTPVFTPASTVTVANQAKKAVLKADPKILDIAPADAAAVSLIKGDFEYTASGTVTHVRGNKVYLFGHPFFNLGSVELPMHKAEVITVVPSFQNSFKLVSTGPMIGAIVQDRFSAIQGQMGKVPYMIPMKVFLPNNNRTFNLELVNHPLLTPLLGAIAMSNIFSVEFKDFGFQSMRVKGKIFIENEKNIVIDDLFSGSSISDELSGLLVAINFFLMNNPDRPIKIQKMDFEIRGSERTRSTRIDNVIINKRAFYPGELIDVNIYLKNERGSAPVERLQVKAPNLKAGSIFYLMVSDKNGIVQFENRNVKSSYMPLNLNYLIRAINNLRKNNRIYIKLMTPSEGVYIKGHEYSNLPSSLQNVFIYNSSSAAQAKMKYSTVSEYQYPVPAVVTGQKLFKLTIKERSDVQ